MVTMKKLSLLTVGLATLLPIYAATHDPDFQRAILHGATAQISVRVVDDEQKPVSDAKIEARFDPALQSAGEVKVASTDTNGIETWPCPGVCLTADYVFPQLEKSVMLFDLGLPQTERPSTYGLSFALWRSHYSKMMAGVQVAPLYGKAADAYGTQVGMCNSAERGVGVQAGPSSATATTRAAATSSSTSRAVSRSSD